MGETDAGVKDMAVQLVAVLRVQGEKGFEVWSQLHGKLAEVAAAAGGDDPRTAVQALLKVAMDASSSQALMRTLEESVSELNPYVLRHLVFLVADELNMTPLCDSGDPVHMVDADGNFCKQNVDRVFNFSTELTASSPPYAVVSIVGAQCIGKSFLLNRLFGTRFPEMDAKRKWCQTTRGIMMSRCIGPSLVLMDVEGFDGREQGQDTLFEKQAALFALTVSDLMMVNISITDICREQGGAAPLFRIIFQERTKLPLGITKLLVVIRFYNGETPIEIMRSEVLESLEKIWKNVNKESVKFKDYIEVNIIGLSDKRSPEFPKEVTLLRKLLSENISSKEPASSFSVKSSMFWDTIKQNKELHIPSHPMAVARLYCRKIVEDILNSLNSQEKYKLLKAEESPRRFKEISDELLEKIKPMYDLKTKKYDPDLRGQERQYLVERLQQIVKDDSREIIWKVKENTLEQFKREIDGKNIQSMKEAEADLYFERIVDAWIYIFMSSFEDEKVFDSDHLSRIRGELKKQLQSYTAQARKEERERKAKEKRRQRRLISTGESMGVSFLMGDVVNPLLRYIYHLMIVIYLVHPMIVIYLVHPMIIIAIYILHPMIMIGIFLLIRVVFCVRGISYHIN